jgi:hypothetical protein
MRNLLRAGVLAGCLGALALLAGSATAGVTPDRAVDQTPATTPSTVDVTFVIDRFVRQGRRIVAHGAVVTKHIYGAQTTAVSRKPFAAAVAAKRATYASASRICDVLTLNLGPLHLELLGLVIDLSRVVLTVKADSRGGLLGSLLCSIAGRGTATAEQLNRAARKLTKSARANGLNKGIQGFQVHAPPGFTQAPGTVCSILDLVLGPLDLNLLGLLVHLDRVRLTITAIRGGGLLGDLLCGLGGGPPPPAPAPARL